MAVAVLTLADVQRLLGRVEYLDWVFVAYQHEFEGPWIVIVYTAADSNDPSRTWTSHVHSPLPPLEDDGAFLRWLAWRTQLIAIHEAREYLRVDGRPVFDPHGGDTPAMQLAALKASRLRSRDASARPSSHTAVLQSSPSGGA